MHDLFVGLLIFYIVLED